MKSPISGLSLLIHMLIIGFAVVWNFANGKGTQSVYQSKPSQGSFLRQTMNRVVSVLIIVSLGSTTFFLASLAVVTGIEEGRDEPQVRFIKQSYADIREGNVDFTSMSRTFGYSVSANESTTQELIIQE